MSVSKRVLVKCDEVIDMRLGVHPWAQMSTPSCSEANTYLQASIPSQRSTEVGAALLHCGPRQRGGSPVLWQAHCPC